MNLSALERMVTEGDMSLDGIRYLLGCRSECEWLDYKEALFLDSDKDLCGFAKDVLAMKNVGGGYIVIGVRDKTWELTGLGAQLPYDTKMLRDKVRHASGVDIEVDIVHHTVSHSDMPKLTALIYVRSSRKRNKRRAPTVAAKDFCTREAYGIRRGDIYVRRGDSTARIQSQAELDDLLDGLEARADEDALKSTKELSPFAVRDGLYRLPEKGFESFIGRQTLRERLMEAVTKDPRIWIINVHGPGGVGKSALVNWATYDFYDKRTFESIIHLTAKETVLTQSGIAKFKTRSLYSIENLLEHILNTFEEPIPEDLAKKESLARELLSAWKTLLVLDNMETVQDGRILQFVQNLPQDSKAKVLMTSRVKSGGWELPLSLKELSLPEVEEFLRIKSGEMNVDFPLGGDICARVREATGGLPLAVQWTIGQYKVLRDINRVLKNVGSSDSPVLEFSFRNVWNGLDHDARAVLAVMTIFDGPPQVKDIVVATEWPPEKIEEALSVLEDVTLVTRTTQTSDGRVTYNALPITLSFARHQLAQMNEFEKKCRQRYQKYNEQMQLQESEVSEFRSTFERYGIVNNNERRASILCRRGQSEMFAGNTDNADLFFKEARLLAPQSSYVYAMSASYELARNHVGNALQFVDEACKRANKRTGSLCYVIKARVLDAQNDKRGRPGALAKALEYDPDDVILRHQYGVALSRAGRPDKAIEQFNIIIDSEMTRTPPRESLLMAIKTRIINYRRIGRIDLADEDLRLAHQILAAHPHLQTQAEQIMELEQE